MSFSLEYLTRQKQDSGGGRNMVNYGQPWFEHVSYSPDMDSLEMIITVKQGRKCLTLSFSNV